MGPHKFIAPRVTGGGAEPCVSCGQYGSSPIHKVSDEDTYSQPERDRDPFDRIADALERIAAALEQQHQDEGIGTITISTPIDR